MRQIEIAEVKNYRGGPLTIPVFDMSGKVVKTPVMNDDGNPAKDAAGNMLFVPATQPGTILELIEFMVLDFPRDQLTLKNITEATRIVTAISAVREKKLETLDLEDASYDWLLETLQNERIGVKMFGMNLPNVLAVLVNATPTG